MNKTVSMLILCVVVFITGCSKEWKDSGKIISKLSCGMDIKNVIEKAKNEDISINILEENTDNIYFTKGKDYLWIFFDKDKKLVSVAKPNWEFKEFGFIGGEVLANIEVMHCDNSG